MPVLGVRSESAGGIAIEQMIRRCAEPRKCAVMPIVKIRQTRCKCPLHRSRRVSSLLLSTAKPHVARLRHFTSLAHRRIGHLGIRGQFNDHPRAQFVNQPKRERHMFNLRRARVRSCFQSMLSRNSRLSGSCVEQATRWNGPHGRRFCCLSSSSIMQAFALGKSH